LDGKWEEKILFSFEYLITGLSHSIELQTAKTKSSFSDWPRPLSNVTLA